MLQAVGRYHSCCPVGHLVVAITHKLLLNVGPLAVADLQLVSYYSQNEACPCCYTASAQTQQPALPMQRLQMWVPSCRTSHNSNKTVSMPVKDLTKQEQTASEKLPQHRKLIMVGKSIVH